MALSAGARPRRKTKNAYDPDFLYDFPSKELFHDHEDDFNLGEQGAPVPHSPSPIKHSTKPAKAKSTTAHSVSPLPLSAKDTGPSTLSFDQQLQLIKLQKEKLELELIVLTISKVPGSFCQCAFYQLEAVVSLNGPIELKAFSSVYGS